MCLKIGKGIDKMLLCSITILTHSIPAFVLLSSASTPYVPHAKSINTTNTNPTIDFDPLHYWVL